MLFSREQLFKADSPQTPGVNLIKNIVIFWTGAFLQSPCCVTKRLTTKSFNFLRIQLSGAPLKDRMGGLPLFNEVQTAQCLLWDRSENAKCYCITLADHRPAISPNSTLPALATSACNSLGCGWGLHWPRASVNHLATGARTYHLPGTNPLEELNVLLRD